MRWALSALTPAALAPLAAQTVLAVPASYPTIAAAVAAAQPGDVVAIAAGTYAPFSCGKAITITALPGATVAVASTQFFLPIVADFAIPANGLAVVQGLRFVNATPPTAVRARVSSGRIAFENCWFEGDVLGDAGLRVDNASVWLRGCRCTGQIGPGVSSGNAGPCAGLLATNATVAAVDCEFLGGILTIDGVVSAGDGIRATASSLHLVRCTATGGPSHFLGCGYPNGHGLHVINGTGTWLADCTLRGGSAPGCASGGDALRNAGAAPVHLTRVTTVPGVGTSSSGAAIFGPSVPDGALGLAAATGDALLGAPYRIDYLAGPNALLLLFASGDLAPLPPAVTVETTWLPSGAPFVGALVADAAGLATFQTTIPNAPALRYVSLWLHAAQWPGSPLHVSPPIGGLLR